MNVARAWAVIAMAVAFLAGAAAGVLGERASTARAPEGPFESYARLLERHLELGPDRAHHLRVLLTAYASDVERVVKAHQADYRAALEPDLRPIHEEYDRLVRDLVVPADRRARFDELATALTLDPTLHDGP